MFGSEIPSNLVLKKVTPKLWLPILTTAWGVVSMCLGFVCRRSTSSFTRTLLTVNATDQ